MDDAPTTTEQALQPIRVGEHFGRTMRYTVEQIAAFAESSLDRNPLHQPAAPGGPIASGQHSAAIMMGLVASHFSRDDDGVRREMLCLNFNFAFKAAVQAERDIDMRWLVSSVEYNARLGGWVGQLNGTAFCGGSDCVVARGTVLVRRLD